jgi:hypothetical protein
VRARLSAELAKPDVLRAAFCNALALVGESDPTMRANASTHWVELIDKLALGVNQPRSGVEAEKETRRSQ